MKITAPSLPFMSAPAAGYDLYAVVGNPIAHSKSPFIHTSFAEQTGERVEYRPVLAPVDQFVPTVEAFMAAGGCGLNVTVPFKLEAHTFATALSPRAAAAGAVNTLRFDGHGEVFGDNTDGVGLVRDIENNLGVAIEGARIVLLGAGGAARGVVLPLLERGPAALIIVNRTAAKAQALAQQFASAAQRAGCRLLGGGPEQIRGLASPQPQAHAYDLIINATAGSLEGALPACDAQAFGPSTLAYDMMYGAQPTVFMRHAHSLGARAVDGLGMLVEQAAESFFVWRGVRPNSMPVLAALRAQLSAPQTSPDIE